MVNVIDNIFKEIENIKDLKEKKKFLEKALKQHSNRKHKGKIIELLKKLDKLEKEKPESKNETKIEIPAMTASRNLRSFIDVEEAPKYEPQERREPARNVNENRGLSRLERLANDLQETNRANERITDYTPRLNETRERTSNLQLYANQEHIRTSMENLNMPENSNELYASRRIHKVEEYVPLDRDQLEIKRWTTNMEFNPRAVEKIELNYNTNMIENLKKQKKLMEEKYK